MRISVITATRNRAVLLPELCASLARQTVSLEWVVVDDGSDDDTPEMLDSFRPPFPLVHVRQAHAGKHVAVNRGVGLARGEFAAIVDSDDRLLSGALAGLLADWAALPDPARFAGVTGRCVDAATGAPLGTDVPGRFLDACWQEAHYRYRLKGDRSGIQRLDVLRRHPFPADRGFVVESQVWRAIGRTHATRYVNRPVLAVGTGTDDRLTARPFGSVAAALRAEHRAILTEDLPWLRHAPAAFARSAVHYARAGLHLGEPPLRGVPAATALLAAAGLPLALFLHRRDAHAEMRAGVSPPTPSASEV